MRSNSTNSQRILGIILMIAGVIVAALSVMADSMNIGGGKGFGYYQMIVLIAGLVIFLIGIAALMNGFSHRTPRGK